MPSNKRQKRWSVSLRPLKGQRLRKLARAMEDSGEANGSLSDTVEKLLDAACEARGIPEETVVEPRKVKPYRTGPLPHKACFSW